MSDAAPPRIALSARLMHEPPAELGFRGKTLQYLEQSLAHWVMGRHALAFMVPALDRRARLPRSQLALRDVADAMDGLVLQGGADLSPASYGQQPLRAEWAGDPIRDRYELELVEAFLHQGKPVLGICRGCQLLNVAFGGSLYQDIQTLRTDAIRHHDAQLYDQLHHWVDVLPGGVLDTLYPSPTHARVSSIHHQAVDRLGADLQVEALSTSDGLVEAISARGSSFVLGVQWHPEFHAPGDALADDGLLDSAPLFDEFLRQALARRT